MQLEYLDLIVFISFIGFVVAFSMFKSRKEKTDEDYFLASRGLKWWIIGFSLIAANISTEQFVGMNGGAAGNVGFAIASYDWIAAISLVFVALFFLPRFLRSGIYTIPEFLEYRYNAAARGIMAFYIMVIYVGVTISAVLYSGGLAIHTIFDYDLTKSIYLIGIIAALYTTWGGLKAVAWADLFLGSALILGGFCVTWFGLKAIGGIPDFLAASGDKMHMVLPGDHLELPWTALFLGIWIPNLYYWGLNQYISQRSLAAKDLRHGQLGVLMAAGIQVILPLIIVIPGIMAWILYKNELQTQDAAFPLLIRNLVPVGLRGFIFAAIAGAVISSLASMLNSAATILTMDLYKRHWKKEASNKSLIFFGRIMTIVFVIIGCIIAPHLGDPKFRGIFHFIQDFQGYISPGILAAFLFGLIFKRTPSSAGITALLLNIPVYGILHLDTFNNVAFLNKMAITFSVIIVVMAFITLIKPLKKEVILPIKNNFPLKPEPLIIMIGGIIIFITILMYLIFW